jgi:DNA (cytosine-5)-methyltransferase 1
MVLLENVRGITYDFLVGENGEKATNYSERLVQELSKDYHVFTRMLKASRFGVPQARPRFYLIALRKGVNRSWLKDDPFTYIISQRKSFLAKRGLPVSPCSGAAISDLEISRNGKIDCPDSYGFQAIGYKHPKTAFQKLMRDGFKGEPSDTRLANHREDIAKRFKAIIRCCKSEGRLNVSISKKLREKYRLKKQAIRVMDPKKPAPTITSMPDDLLHYNEPRTLTVRETARLQTFPDWFVFKGKYTTGGHLRRLEVPRFTQVANAVPPLIAELFGECLLQFKRTNRKKKRARKAA